jgi:hypothetical protein
MLLRCAAPFTALLLGSAFAFADPPPEDLLLPVTPSGSASAPAAPTTAPVVPPASSTEKAAPAATATGPILPPGSAAGPAAPVTTTRPAPPEVPPPATATTTGTLELNTPMTVGLSMFTLSYVPCAVIGAVTEDGDAIPMVLPFVGPWITGHLVKPDDWGWVFFGGLSTVQVVGAAVFAFGALLPRDPAAKRGPRQTTAASVRAAPVVGPGTLGLSIQGAF